MRWLPPSIVGLVLSGFVLVSGQVTATDSTTVRDTPGAGRVSTSPIPSTWLYVRTSPTGARIKLDNQPRGTSDQLFKVPRGVRKMTVTVELDGHYPQQQEVEIRGGQITRVVFELEPVPETPSSPWAKAGGPIAVPPDCVTLGYVADRSTDKRSLGGTGQAVRFERPEDAKYVCAVQIYGSRYGEPEPPKEDFHVYLLDGDRKVIKEFGYPYATVRRTGEMHWYTLPMPPTEVPKVFYVALSFNAARTKGVYVGLDKSVKEFHSYYGLPDKGYEEVPDGDWMVRACLVPGRAIEPSPNPFADQFSE